MIIKTIHINRRTIYAAALVIFILATGVAVHFSKGQAVAVFSQQDIYDKILEEGLPNDNENEYSLKKTVDDILGFDITKGEEIIKEFSPIFEEDNAEINEQLSPQSTPESSPSPTSAPTTVNAALPKREQIVSNKGLEISNATTNAIDTNEALNREPAFDIACDGSKEILIVHTHSTESYGKDGDRNTNDQRNIMAVGEEMKRVFEKNGIGTIHNTTVHDYPSYQGAYTRTLTTTNQILKENPSIKIVLDVHRDGYVYADGSKLTKSVQVNGENAAQVMIVCGTDALGLNHPRWRDNLSFAAKIQSGAMLSYPGLMRPVDVRRERFNMHTTTGSLLLEVGANGNTLEEANVTNMCKGNENKKPVDF